MATTALAAPVGYVTAGLPSVGAYLACLASYNSGTLHGAWVDLGPDGATTVEEIQACIDYMLSLSTQPGAEEWAMHDSCGLPACLSKNEWPQLADLAQFAENAADLDDSELIAYRMVCDDRGEVVDLDEFREAFCGVYDSPEEYAQDMAEECYSEALGALPCSLAAAIDWAQVWRDLDCDGYSAEYSSDAGGYIITRPV